MTWTEKDIPDLSGRTAVVTGGNGGLGYQTALALAGAGAHVVVAARDPEKTAAATARIRERYPAASLEVVPLDLGDLSVVSTAADAVLAAHERIDLLVNNAGVMAMPQRTTADGFEMQLGVDHLGHWAFTAHLLPGAAARPRGPGGDGDQHRPVHGRPAGPGRPAHDGGSTGRGAPTRGPRWPTTTSGWACSSSSRGPGVAAASLIAHPGLSNTDLQARTVREGGGGWVGRGRARDDGAVGHDARSRAPGRSCGRPPTRRRSGGELYAPRFGSHGPAGAAPDPAPVRPAEADRRPVGGLRARDRHPPGSCRPPGASGGRRARAARGRAARCRGPPARRRRRTPTTPRCGGRRGGTRPAAPRRRSGRPTA